MEGSGSAGNGTTRRELLKRGGAAAIGVGIGGGVLGGSATAATRVHRRSGAKTPLDTLIVAVEGDVDTFDPNLVVSSAPGETVIQNVFDQLTQYRPVTKRIGGVTFPTVDTGSMRSMLAESWTVKGDRIVFTLRKGLRYHDGTPLTARHVVEGYRRIFDTKSLTSFLLGMAGVANAKSIRMLDARHIEIRLVHANPLFMKNNTMLEASFVNFAEAKKHASKGDPWGTQYFKKNLATGNGPYSLEEYVPGDRMVMKAYKGYYGGTPHLAHVIQKIVPDAADRVLLLRRGEVDMITLPPTKELDALKEDRSLRVLSYPSARHLLLSMNTKMPPFDNKLVRQAVSYAVPYDDILKFVFRGYAQPSRSIVSLGFPTHDESGFRYHTDLKKAAQLLAAAGFPNGKGAPKITLTARAGWEEAQRAVIITQSNLKKLGLNVEIQQLPLAPFNEQEQGRKLQFWTQEWLSWVQDPFYHLHWLTNSASPTNYVSYTNPKVDALINKFTLSPDAAARASASRQVQRMVADDAPYALVAHPNATVVVRANVRGYRLYNDQLTRYSQMRKVQEA